MIHLPLYQLMKGTSRRNCLHPWMLQNVTLRNLLIFNRWEPQDEAGTISTFTNLKDTFNFISGDCFNQVKRRCFFDESSKITSATLLCNMKLVYLNSFVSTPLFSSCKHQFYRCLQGRRSTSL